MRDLAAHIIRRAQRSGDRIDGDGSTDAAGRLAAEAIRLARVATSIHLAEAARLHAAAGAERDRAVVTRENAR